MDAYLLISRYSTLNFNHKWRQREQQIADYTQRVIANDKVTIQYNVPIGEAQTWDYITVRQYDPDGVEIPITPNLLYATSEREFYGVLADTRERGCYRIVFELTKAGTTTVVAESLFEVILPEDEGADDLVLFRYNNIDHKDNTVFLDDFYFRCEARLFPQNETYGIEDNQFRDQDYDPRTLSAEAYLTYGLTIGGSGGVPNWVADKINLIFSCTEVYITEWPVEYVRSDGATVERTTLGDMNPLYLFTLNIEKTLGGVEAVLIGKVDAPPEEEESANLMFYIDVEEAEQDVPIDPEFTIDPTNIQVGATDTAAKAITVTCPDNTWTVYLPGAGGDWITVAKTSATQATVTLAENSGTIERSAIVRFTWVNPATGQYENRDLLVLQYASSSQPPQAITITGLVVDSETLTAVAGATVVLRNNGIQYATTTTDSSGNYSFQTNWIESTWNSAILSLQAGKEGYITTDAESFFKPSFAIATASPVTQPSILLQNNGIANIIINVEVVEQTGTIIVHGRITNSSSTPIIGAGISITDSNGVLLGMGVSKANGEYQVGIDLTEQQYNATSLRLIINEQSGTYQTYDEPILKPSYAIAAAMGITANAQLTLIPSSGSYYVDTSDNIVPFNVQDAPLINFSTSSPYTASVIINGVPVRKNDIKELHFGTDYEVENTIIGNNFLTYFQTLEILDIRGLKNVPNSTRGNVANVFQECRALREIIWGETRPLFNSVTATNAMQNVPRDSGCIRHHATQAAADAVLAAYGGKISLWTVVID